MEANDAEVSKVMGDLDVLTLTPDLLVKIQQTWNQFYPTIPLQPEVLSTFSEPILSQLANGKKPNLSNEIINPKKGDTVLHTVAKLGLEAELQFLIENGANPNLRNRWKSTSLHKAAEGGNMDTAVRIMKTLIKNGGDVYFNDEDDFTFLYLMISNKNCTQKHLQEMAQFLVETGHSQVFNSPSGEYRKSVFQWAVSHFELDWETLTLLHEHGVDFNFKNKFDGSVFYHAISGKRSDAFLSNLLQHGVDVRAITSDREWKNSHLHHAAGFGTVGALKLILDLDAIDINLPNREGNTPLHQAVKFSDENVVEKVELLLGRGADKSIKNAKGQTPHDIALSPVYGKVNNKLVDLLKL